MYLEKYILHFIFLRSFIFSMKKFILFCLFIIIFCANCLALPLLNLGATVGIRGGYTASGFSTKKYSGDSIKNAEKYFGSAVFSITALSFRGELEYIFRPNFVEFNIDNKTDKIDYASQTMVGLYYNVLSVAIVDVYAGASVGRNKIKGDLIQSYDKTTWAVGVNVDVSLLMLKLEVGYRYVDMGEVISISNLKQDLKSHDIYFGVKMGI